MNYRADIDGLRAISILAVVAFHVGVPYVFGGYVGVDIFFVISGFLITKLLLEEKARTGKIDLAAFWARRVRRILPSLLFVITLTLIVGSFILQRVSGEIGNLAKAIIAALLVNANHHFLMVMGDYFGTAAEMNPLLHLWTLSVEEQFYLIWPLFLLLVVNKTQVLRNSLISTVFLASFIGCVVLTFIARDQAFFLMPARAWEFMAGAALSVIHIRGVGERKLLGLLIAILGFSLLLYSIFFLANAATFPGFIALYPVSGAVFTILAGIVWPNNPISVILKTSLLTYIGRISYVWYLWHWPILVLGRSVNLYERHLNHDLLAAALSFVLAVITHHYVETPLRRYGVGNLYWNSKRILLLGTTSTASICILAILMGAWARYGWFYSDQERYLDAARHDLPSLSCLFTEGNKESDYSKCLPINSKSNNSVLLWGDSHANQWSPAIIEAAQNQNTFPIILSRRACMPILGDLHDKGCMQFNDYVISQLNEMRRNGLQGVVLAARWPEYLGTEPISIGDSKSALYFNEKNQSNTIPVFEARLQSLIHKMDEMKLRVLIVLPSPVLRYTAVHCLAVKPANECGISQMTFNEYAKDSISIIKRVANQFQNVRLMEPQDFMCTEGFCSAIQKGVIAYTDDDHLAKSFVKKLSSRFNEDIIWLMGSALK